VNGDCVAAAVDPGIAMAELSDLKIEPFTAKRVRNEHPGGKMTWLTFHTVRNAIVRACREFGPTGPMGEIKLDPAVVDLDEQLEEDPDFWQPGDDTPRYLVGDRVIDNERFIHVTLNAPHAMNAVWLVAIVAALREHRGWAVEVDNIPDSSLLIFGKRLLVKGRQLAACNDAAQVIEVAARLLRRGPRQWWQIWR
jgi:hypothetical protein